MFFNSNVFDFATDGFGIPDIFFRDAFLDESFTSEEEDESPPDRHVQISLTLEQCYNGANTEIDLKRTKECSECKKRVKRAKLTSHGKGHRLKHKTFCSACESKGVLTEDVKINVEVPRGTRNNFQLRLRGEGDVCAQNLHAGHGDLVVHCAVLPHPVFKVERNDLIAKHEISWAEAFTGVSFVVEHLDGRKILVDIFDEVVHNGDSREILGEGMPIHEATREKSHTPLGSHGNLIIILSVIYPEVISAAVLEEMEKVLPKSKTYTTEVHESSPVTQYCTLIKRTFPEVQAEIQQQCISDEEY